MRSVNRAGVVLLAVVLAAAGCGSGDDATAVLFIGNSQTDANDLPGMFEAFAESGGFPVDVAASARGDARLRDHDHPGRSKTMLRQGGWDYMVLQEASPVAANGAHRATAMSPAVTNLAREARLYGTEPVLMLPWAWDDGDRSAGFASYRTMQTAVTEGSRLVAEDVGLAIAPVGEAWALARDAGAALYQPDGHHPDVAGTYLAAAVIYATLFEADPREVTDDAGLPAELAERLRHHAAVVAHDHRAEWTGGTG